MSNVIQLFPKSYTEKLKETIQSKRMTDLEAEQLLDDVRVQLSIYGAEHLLDDKPLSLHEDKEIMLEQISQYFAALTQTALFFAYISKSCVEGHQQAMNANKEKDERLKAIMQSAFKDIEKDCVGGDEILKRAMKVFREESGKINT